jgi:hypothetical protein
MKIVTSDLIALAMDLSSATAQDPWLVFYTLSVSVHTDLKVAATLPSSHSARLNAVRPRSASSQFSFPTGMSTSRPFASMSQMRCYPLGFPVVLSKLTISIRTKSPIAKETASRHLGILISSALILSSGRTASSLF